MKNYSHDKIEIQLVGNKLDLKSKLVCDYKGELLVLMRRRPSLGIMALGISKSRLKVEKESISVF